MLPKWKLAIIAFLVLSGISGGLRYSLHRYREDPTLDARLDTITTDYRRILLLMDGAESLDAATRSRCRTAGRRIFWDEQQTIRELAAELTRAPQKIGQVVRYVDPALTVPGTAHLRDADRLAFLDLFEELASNTQSNDVRAVLDDLHSIQNSYREEVSRIFSQFATRGANGKREKWDSYIAWLHTLDSRDRILSQFNDDVTDESETGTRGKAYPNEISGIDFAPKTVALTFDDGPHPKYTEEVAALLRKYGIRAGFFELGQNLGKVAPDSGDISLSRNAEITKRLLAAGHTIANHTYSHRVLSTLSEADRAKEIESTNQILEKITGAKPLLFRPPYGARNQEVFKQITGEGLQDVLWTIDSEDWADPIPESIAMRVLHQVNESHKGVILFHDIHKQSVEALPLVLDELTSQSYTFLAFDGAKLVKSTPPEGSERAAPPATPVQTVVGEKLNPYRKSWAVIIGIDDYQNWPKLRYAVNDATAIEQTLVSKFGFRPENIHKFLNRDATRQNIMQVLGDDLADPNQVSHDDRVFFFFAGHGATRTTAYGRQSGFIIPADADSNNYYSTAISMTALREAADLIPAKHIYFVMDSCYSGLALTRGSGTFSRDRGYLDEVTRRDARQILTAGGADQLVSDDGPNGHSVFTWALLQGLDGKADLDGNGVITASELGAYVSPVVAGFSKQTPAMGNLIGSEGGEFIFELQPEALTQSSGQFDTKASELNQQLAGLEQEIAAKQAELLKLQQSVQAESEKLANHAAPPQPKPETPVARAYDLDRQGRQFYREQKYNDAQSAFAKAVSLKPNDAVLLNNLGFIFYELGRYNDAVTWLEKTLAADPNRKEAHGNIADAYLKLGRKAEAKKHYERYLELYPNSPKAAEIRSVLATL
jgi:peptidoglycan/xylan/chitin deacetylase (PgdA/CDA1 family)/tetratricopeptide (TPR) repeat protein